MGPPSGFSRLSQTAAFSLSRCNSMPTQNLPPDVFCSEASQVTAFASESRTRIVELSYRDQNRASFAPEGARQSVEKGVRPLKYSPHSFHNRNCCDSHSNSCRTFRPGRLPGISPRPLLLRYATGIEELHSVPQPDSPGRIGPFADGCGI